MQKTVLAAAIALALTTGISAPAFAGDARHKEWIPILSVPGNHDIDDLAADPVRYLIALLLPAVQAAR